MSMYLYNGHKFPAHPKTGEEGFDFSFIVLHDKYAELIIANKKGNFYPDGDGYYYAVKKLDAEPVAFLYNGVRLPALPEWDKTAYPYAAIYADSLAEGTYCLMLLPEHLSRGLGGIGWAIPVGTTYYSVEGTAWVYNSYADTGEGIVWDVMWSSYDIIDTNGSVYLVASEPVPVYE